MKTSPVNKTKHPVLAVLSFAALVLALTPFPTSAVQITVPFNTGAAVISGGYLWVGTEDGIVRLNMNDGTWRRFSDVNEIYLYRVFDIAADGSGAVWALSGGGLSVHIGNSSGIIDTHEGLISIRVTALAVDPSGNIWVGTRDGISRVEGSSWKSNTTANGLASNYIRSIAFGADGAAWIQTDKGISRFAGTAFTNFAFTDSLEFAKFDGMRVSPDNSVWLYSLESVLRLSGGTWTNFKILTFGDDGTGIRDMEIDQNGIVWIGLGGLFGGPVMSFEGGSWIRHEFIDNNVRSMYIDADNVKWFSSHEKLVRFNGTDWTFYASPPEYLLSGCLKILSDDHGRKWLISYREVFMFDNGAWTRFTFEPNGVEETDAAHPEPVRVANFPNPFNAGTTITFAIPSDAVVSFDVFDVTGRKVATLVNGPVSAGAHAVRFDGSGLASGVYLYRFESAGQTAHGRMLLLK
jgi:ligand-binding sensor domain-containing protein